jgi:hypothetical protein
MNKIKNIFKILSAQALTVLVILLVIALVGQTYTFLNPSYENIDVIPDRQLGWKFKPNSIFTYTGVHWYKNEFKTQIKTNSLGFRDKERNFFKKKDLINVAVIGDSFVVAREVPFDKTPSQLLERYLNESNPGGLSVRKKYEVLNFGVTGFGIQQSLLTNRIYVKDFAPKYVFLFIFEDTFWRAVSISHAITSTMNQNQKLNIRPTFDMLADNLQELIQILNFKEFHQYLVELEKNKLDLGKNFHFSEEEYLEFILKQRSLVTRGKIAQISEKLKSMELRSYGPYDFNKFVTLQNQVVNSKFDGRRTRVREQKLFILGFWSKLLSDFQILKKSFRPELIMQNEMEKLLSIYSPEKGSQDLFSGSVNFPNFEKTLFINLKTIEVMRNDVESYGGNLVIVDAISNRIQKGRLPANLLSRVLEYYCIENKIGYIPLYEDLNIENSNDNKTSWAFDGHFNELGTQIFAESMYRWLQNKGVGASLNN